MCWEELFFLTAILTGSFAEVYDVTTIYRVDEPAGGIENDTSQTSAEIHGRTNALGLPFLVLGNFVEPDVGVELPPCEAIRLGYIRCDWELDNWDWVVREDPPMLDTGDWSEFKVSDTPSEYLKFDEALFFRFYGLVHNQSYINIVLTPTRAHIYRQEAFYYIQLSRMHQSYFHRCDNQFYERFTRFKDMDENIISAHCERVANITLQMEKWTYGRVDISNYLLIEINNNGSIQLWNTKAKTIPMMKWVDTHPIPINFFTIRTDEAGTAQIKAINYGKGLVLSMSRNVNVASIVSPPLTLSSAHVCVSVVYHMTQSTTPTVITVASPTQTVHIGEINTFQKDGWKVDRFKATLPETMLNKTVRVSVKSVKNLGVLEIQRIAGCNPDDDEDIATIPDLGEKSSPGERVAYNVAVRPPEGWDQQDAFLSVGDCENGGLSYGGQCACPAGFTGDKCQTGCGANRYGRDCKGVCSLREQACRGLTLCTPVVGCFCAPGFTGYECNQTCDGRRYGVGCSQRCANCVGPCNIYTGICPSGCKPGYRPPLCKSVYAYPQFAPQVNTLKYGEAEIVPDLNHNLGEGSPAFYQVQYKLANSSLWHTFVTRHVSDPSPVVVVELQDGVEYHARIVLIDEDLNGYHDSLVPQTKFRTKCFIPNKYEYNITIETTDTSITASWLYAPDDGHSCPVVNYQVDWREGWRWLTRNVSETRARLVNKLPLTCYQIRVRALTSADYAPYSRTVTVTTGKHAPGPVSNLSLVQSESSALAVSWSLPQDNHLYELSYVVTYQCLRLASCDRGCSGGGQAHVTDSKVTLHGLQPLAQYRVTVAAVDRNAGAEVTAMFATQHSVPSEVVRKSSREPEVTDTSATVYWDPVEVCTGFFQQFSFQLFKSNDLNSFIVSNVTKDNFTTFEDLEAKTLYAVKVFVVSSAGLNQSAYHRIDFTTNASAPESVKELTVYKTGRQLIGLRWARPGRVYGYLRRFMVSHAAIGINSEKAEDVRVADEEPKHCAAWPQLFCMTIYELTPDTEYNISVKAQNGEVDEYGSSSTVLAITKEAAPDKPTDLRVANVTSSSFTLYWSLPDHSNGILRSFLVTVAEIERIDIKQCCKQFPNLEIPVTEELPVYNTEVVGLNPASTYAVGVTGKTISLGAPESLSVHTKPPPLGVVGKPPSVLLSGGEIRWPEPSAMDEALLQLYRPLIRGHMLVVLTSDPVSSESSGVRDEQLYALIRSTLNSSFFAVADYKTSDTFKLDTEGTYEGYWGGSSWILKSTTEFKMAAVQVIKYFKTYSVDVVLSEPFENIKKI